MTSLHNIATLLEERLPAQVWRLLQRAGDVADGTGIPLYLVGGTVRDALLGQPTWDVDLVVEGTAQAFAAALGETVGGRIVSHSQFGTVQLRTDELRVDIAASRQERYARPGALPIVSPGTLAEDLHRRDFSINAIAVALNKERWSQVLDPEGGWADIQAKRVRVLHDGSFQDDPTRVLRALRYSVRIGFALEAATERRFGEMRTIWQWSARRAGGRSWSGCCKSLRQSVRCCEGRSWACFRTCIPHST